MKKIASLYFFCSLTLLGLSQTEDRFKGLNKKELQETILRTEEDLLQKLEEKDSILREHKLTIQEIKESNREIQYRLDQTESTVEARDELIDTLRKQINSLHEHLKKFREPTQNKLVIYCDSAVHFGGPMLEEDGVIWRETQFQKMENVFVIDVNQSTLQQYNNGHHLHSWDFSQNGFIDKTGYFISSYIEVNDEDGDGLGVQYLSIQIDWENKTGFIELEWQGRIFSAGSIDKTD